MVPSAQDAKGRPSVDGPTRFAGQFQGPQGCGGNRVKKLTGNVDLPFRSDGCCLPPALGALDHEKVLRKQKARTQQVTQSNAPTRPFRGSLLGFLRRGPELCTGRGRGLGMDWAGQWEGRFPWD